MHILRDTSEITHLIKPEIIPNGMQLLINILCRRSNLHKLPEGLKFFGRAGFNAPRVVEDKPEPGWEPELVINVV
jgi:hypothetical protein